MLSAKRNLHSISKIPRYILKNRNRSTTTLIRKTRFSVLQAAHNNRIAPCFVLGIAMATDS